MHKLKLILLERTIHALPVHCIYMPTCIYVSGMFAIRAEREYVIGEDFMKAVRKVGDTKKLEAKLDYKQI